MALGQYVWDDGLDPNLYERSHHRNPHILLEKFYESDLTIAQAWCEEHGYTELHALDGTPNPFWAYPPQAVMAEPLDMSQVRAWKSSICD
jgi:hypothetical protein